MDRNEFIENVRMTRSSLSAFLRVLGIKADLVDDMSQEVYLIAYKRLESFDPEQDFGKWIRGIARNVVSNERRREKSRISRLKDRALTDRMLERFNKDNVWNVKQELIPVLNDCLHNLSEKNRELIKRRYTERENSQQLAKTFGKTPGAIRKLLMRIRQALLKCIESRVGTVGDA